MNDKLGQEIKVGDIIVYGHALDRSAALRVGKVTALLEKPDEYYKDRTAYRITVQGIEDGWPGDEPKLTDRKGTLLFPDRIIVLSNDIIPDKYWKLLLGV